MNLTKKKLLSWYISRLHCLHETDIASKEAKAIEDLISRYGDGGPKVTYRMLENAVIEIRLSRPEVPNMALVLKLKDALERRGVEVEEEKHG